MDSITADPVVSTFTDGLAPDPVPLVVDLDGTLIKNDLLVESAVRLILKNPFYAFLLPLWLFRGKRALKSELARRVAIDASVLPYNATFLAYLREQHATGRKLVLATASHRLLAQPVMEFLGLFSELIATDEGHNLAGRHKREALVARFGERGFDYAGNSSADLAIWPSARAAIVVNPERGVERRARARSNVSAVYNDRKSPLKVVLRAIRIHQWLKNLLVFLALIAAHAWDDRVAVTGSVLAFVAFSFCASAIYLLNDAFDLDSDRAHARKRHRPLAAGELSLLTAAMLGLLLLLGGFFIATMLSADFLLVLTVYVLTTSAYSFAIKSLVLIDVLLLAALYTIRVIGGAAATGVYLSYWLMAFSMMLFTSLALVKRCAELESLRSENKLVAKGRDYRVVDLPQLTSLGTASAIGAVVILALYINNPEIVKHYRHSQVLWALCPLLMYWLGRMWIKSGRGEMHDDPIVYSAKDIVSWVVVALGFAVMVIAI